MPTTDIYARLRNMVGGFLMGAADVETPSGSSVAAELGSLTGMVGRQIDTPSGAAELAIDKFGYIIRALLANGRHHFSQLSVAPFDRADPARLVEGPSGALMVTGAAGFSPTALERTFLQDLTGTEFEGATHIVRDPNGFVIEALWSDGRRKTSATPVVAAVPFTLIDTVALPNGALAQNPNGGFTCTGADQIDTGQTWSDCWLVGNHGQATEAGGAFTSSVVLLSPDRRVKLKEWAMPAGAESVQGVCRGFAANTYWAVDKRPSSPANSLIRLFDFTGAEITASRITVAEIMAAAGLSALDFEFNGIALHPSAGTSGSLWIGCEGVARAYLFDLATRTITRTLTTLTTDADQLGYDQATDRLYFSYGANGSNGNVRFLNAVTGAAIKTLTGLTLSQSIEGCKVDHMGRLVTFNDGAFHIVAKPPLALSNTYTFSLGV